MLPVSRVSVSREDVYSDTDNFPVSVAEAKLFMRQPADVTTEDAIIEGMIRSSISLVENYTRRSLVTKTITQWLDGFSTDRYFGLLSGDQIYLASPPVISVTSVSFFDVDDSEEVMSSSLYIVDGDQGRVVPNDGQEWITSQREVRACKIVYSAGYGDPSDVPAPIVHVIKSIVSRLFMDCDKTPMSDAIKSVLDGYKIHRFDIPYAGIDIGK